MTNAKKLIPATAVAVLFTLAPIMLGETAAASRVVSNCSGGAQEAVEAITSNVNASIVVGFGAVMPSSTLAGGASGAAGDSDLYSVTWSGESYSTVGWWIAQAQVSVNGGAFVNLDPVGPNIMHTGALRETNTITWCKRLPATVGTSFRIVWGKVGGGTATIDNYVTRVERSN